MFILLSKIVMLCYNFFCTKFYPHTKKKSLRLASYLKKTINKADLLLKITQLNLLDNKIYYKQILINT